MFFRSQAKVFMLYKPAVCFFLQGMEFSHAAQKLAASFVMLPANKLSRGSRNWPGSTASISRTHPMCFRSHECLLDARSLSLFLLCAPNVSVFSLLLCPQDELQPCEVMLSFRWFGCYFSVCGASICCSTCQK